MRVFAIGDPQAPFAHVLDVLDRHGALAGDRIAPDVTLVSIGDHFDYDLNDPITAGTEGIKLLRWLASHDPRNAIIMLGNHDVSRVMELASIDDPRFAEARVLGRSIDETKKREGREAADRRERDEFHVQFPELPTYGLASRDYASFSVEQRELVIELLLAGRFELATTATLADGRAVLVTHAGVTWRELTLMAIPLERDPRVIAARLQSWLTGAVDDVRADWERGVSTPLSLDPIHVAGSMGEEGGGLLYHRPSSPSGRGVDPGWAFSAARPRRYDPRQLPAGLRQVAGHTGHNKCLEELGDDGPTDAARAKPRGGIRTLRVKDGLVTYDLGILPDDPGAADLYMIDGELRRVAAQDYALLSLAAVG
ncbi:MAG TPA: hypothetical protein VGO00_08585 [Kofleriaceae bacterium]|nr:hypothetical protein [Kofleriaceae bacterium]